MYKVGCLRPQLMHPHERSAMTVEWYLSTSDCMKSCFSLSSGSLVKGKSWCKMVVCVLKGRLVSADAVDSIPGTSHCTLCQTESVWLLRDLHCLLRVPQDSTFRILSTRHRTSIKQDTSASAGLLLAGPPHQISAPFFVGAEHISGSATPRLSVCACTCSCPDRSEGGPAEARAIRCDQLPACHVK